MLWHRLPASQAYPHSWNDLIEHSPSFHLQGHLYSAHAKSGSQHLGNGPCTTKLQMSRSTQSSQRKSLACRSWCRELLRFSNDWAPGSLCRFYHSTRSAKSKSAATDMRIPTRCHFLHLACSDSTNSPLERRMARGLSRSNSSGCLVVCLWQYFLATTF